MSHTKEIWKPEESGMYILACDPDGNHGYVAVEIRGWGRLSKLGDEEAVKIQKDRARRIAALWNAAEELGLTTEAIREGAIQRTFVLAESRAGVIEAALERLETLEREKAESEHALGFAIDRVERLEAEKAEMYELINELILTVPRGSFFAPLILRTETFIKKAMNEKARGGE